MTEVFDASHIYQLAPEEGLTAQLGPSAPLHLRGRTAFSTAPSYSDIEERVAGGWSFKLTSLSEEFGEKEYRERYGHDAIALLGIRDDGAGVKVFTPEGAPDFAADTSVISLVPPSD